MAHMPGLEAIGGTHNPPTPPRRQSQHSSIAKTAIMSSATATKTLPHTSEGVHEFLEPSRKSPSSKVTEASEAEKLEQKDKLSPMTMTQLRSSLGAALSDTPASSAPSSPRIEARTNSRSSSRSRPTTLDIPGLTKSRVSPDGRISQRDVGAKLVIVMVGLPARGKSYVTKKIARYLNWVQHDTKIFNVGERRRIAASNVDETAHPTDINVPSVNVQDTTNGSNDGNSLGPPAIDIVNPAKEQSEHEAHAMAQDASFFDPQNVVAAHIREQVAMSTLDELLDYVLRQGGSVGILDATNSTIARRKAIIKRVRERAGPELGVLFLESQCLDKNLLESNMRLKLSGPDYKGQDPVTALADFKARVAIYEKNYVPLGEYEEKNNMQFIQMIDVGRKVVSHQIKGFLAAQTVYYLLNFNLAARQIWITRHGESIDNVKGKIGGDSELSNKGRKYAKTLARFIDHQRHAFHDRQIEKQATTHFPPLPGDTTPPNPEYRTTVNGEQAEIEEKNFCVWTSMLKRSIETAQFFNEDDYDVKQWRMLNELYAGELEGLTYEQIQNEHAAEYRTRRRDKMQYRYPGPGGEGYHDVINRLRQVILEVERMTDHVLLIGHRSVARVLLAYFMGLRREDVADLDVPLGVLYCLEPKPYGVEFKAYRYNEQTDWFDLDPDYKLQRAPSDE